MSNKYQTLILQETIRSQTPPGQISEAAAQSGSVIFIPPSIFISSRSRRGKIVIAGHVLQLFLGDPEAFPGLIGYVIPPVYSRLVQGSSPVWEFKEYFQIESSGVRF